MHFTRRAVAPDNALVHMKDYKTPVANAVARLCWEQRNKSDEFDLVRKVGDEWQVNANGLHDAMEEKGIKLPQTTITRLLNGAEPKIQTVQALAKFFKVDITEIRGEIAPSPITPRVRSITPIDSLWPFPSVKPERVKHLSPEQRWTLSGWLDAKIDLLEQEANAGNGKQPG